MNWFPKLTQILVKIELSQKSGVVQTRLLVPSLFFWINALASFFLVESSLETNLIIISFSFSSNCIFCLGDGFSTCLIGSKIGLFSILFCSLLISSFSLLLIDNLFRPFDIRVKIVPPVTGPAGGFTFWNITFF